MKTTHTLLMLILISFSGLAQKPKVNPTKETTPSAKTTELSNAEKMPYSRANKYWGPGTFYLYAPGKPNNKMANNRLSAMRDLTGISYDDLHTELAKQGYVRLAKNEIKNKWFNRSKSKDLECYYSPDKSYILQPGIQGLSQSPAAPDKYDFKVSNTIIHRVLYPKEDTVRVMEAVWQFLRDLRELKANLMDIESKFHKSREGVYPIEQVGFSGWSYFRAGSWVQLMENGTPKNYYERHENVIRRTIGKPGFVMWINGVETDFFYALQVMLTKEGYILNYHVIASTLFDLPPGITWVMEYPNNVRQNKILIQNDKDVISQYKGKLPPNFEELDLLLHISK